MSGFKECPECETYAVCAYHERCRTEVTALPPPEPQGGSERSRLATGSLPVSSADICEVADFLERRASLPDEDQTARALRYCAGILTRHAFYVRRQMERTTERQPEENTKPSGA